MHDAFQNGRIVIDTLEASGYEAYFVGGCVRDYLIGRTIKDVDITTNALPDTVESLFDKTIDVGKAHGTIIVMLNEEQIEVTTYRTETTYSDFRRPDHVNFTSRLEEDLKRRDFTVNAIAMTRDMRVIDPNDGQSDIAQRLIQTVGEAEARFNEDALRMLRALRFSVQLNFDISSATYEAIKQSAHLIEHVSIERIIIEMKKMYETGQIFNYKTAIFKSGILQYVPVLKDFNETLFRQLMTDSLAVELAVHIYFNHINPHELGSLRISNDERLYIKKMVSLMQATETEYRDARLLAYRYTQNLLHDCVTLIDKNRTLFNQVDLAFIKEAQNVRPHLPIYSSSDLAIDGHAILQITGHNPGSWMRDVIQALEERVILGELDNTKECLTAWVKTYEF